MQFMFLPLIVAIMSLKFGIDPIVQNSSMMKLILIGFFPPKQSPRGVSLKYRNEKKNDDRNRNGLSPSVMMH